MADAFKKWVANIANQYCLSQAMKLQRSFWDSLLWFLLVMVTQ